MTQAEAAVAEVTDEVTEEKKYRLTLEVDIQNVGPCRKHVRVKVPRTDIEHFEGEATDEIVQTAEIGRAHV